MDSHQQNGARENDPLVKHLWTASRSGLEGLGSRHRHNQPTPS